MTRILLQLISRIALVCSCVIAFTLLIGRMLPPELELLFTASYNLRDLNLYRMSLQRKMSQTITHHPNSVFYPDWSPDGQRIALVSDRDGCYNIFVTDAQGHDTKLLIQETLIYSNPFWSQDGK